MCRWSLCPLLCHFFRELNWTQCFIEIWIWKQNNTENAEQNWMSNRACVLPLKYKPQLTLCSASRDSWRGWVNSTVSHCSHQYYYIGFTFLHSVSYSDSKRSYQVQIRSRSFWCEQEKLWDWNLALTFRHPVSKYVWENSNTAFNINSESLTSFLLTVTYHLA